MTSSIATYAPQRAMPAPAIPRLAPLLGTSSRSSTTLTVSPAAAAGRLREVTRARPVITTNTRYNP